MCDELKKELEKRLAAAIKIILRPESYKICEGCDSIVTLWTNICPNCHSYRFEEDGGSVMDQAISLSRQEQKTVTKEDMF